MKRPSIVSQGSLTRIFQAAGEAWKRCDFQSAIEMMERASRLAPSNMMILLDLGRMNGLRYDYAVAEKWFEQALRVAPKKSDVLVIASQHSRDFNNLAMAENYLKRALEQKDIAPTTIVKLAELYERLRRTEDASALADQALRLDANCAPALLLRARLQRQSEHLEAAEKTLRNFPINVEPAIRASAFYELGGTLDRQGRYDEAMTAFLEAKALLNPLAARHVAELKVIRTRIQYLTANSSIDMLRQWFVTSDQLRPLHRMALLGGHPRSGTTLLEQVLDSHPDIVSAEETEIFYNDAYGPLMRGHPDDTAMFSSLATATTPALQQARQHYFRAMDLSLGQTVGGRLLIDKNPSYTFLIPGFVRVFPEAKLLIALRDPRDVVMSCFMQNLPLNQSGAAFLHLENTVAEYAALMDVWLTLKPKLKNPWREVRYEDLVEDLKTAAQQTLTFLEVPWDERVLGFYEHARNKTVRSPTYTDVTQPVYKRALGRWRNYQKHLEPHLKKLTPFVKAFGYE